MWPIRCDRFKRLVHRLGTCHCGTLAAANLPICRTGGIRMPELLVGPLLRYVDGAAASIWVETSEPCPVTVVASDGTRAVTETFTVHDHHYAIADLVGL